MTNGAVTFERTKEPGINGKIGAPKSRRRMDPTTAHASQEDPCDAHE